MEATKAAKSIEDIKAMTEPATEFFCPRHEEEFAIKFGDFRLRDMDSGTILFHISEEQRSAFEATITSDE